MSHKITIIGRVLRQYLAKTFAPQLQQEYAAVLTEITDAEPKLRPDRLARR